MGGIRDSTMRSTVSMNRGKYRNQEGIWTLWERQGEQKDSFVKMRTFLSQYRYLICFNWSECPESCTSASLDFPSLSWIFNPSLLSLNQRVVLDRVIRAVDCDKPKVELRNVIPVNQVYCMLTRALNPVRVTELSVTNLTKRALVVDVIGPGVEDPHSLARRGPEASTPS